MFKNIVFSNLCATKLQDLNGTTIDRDTCESFNEGILKQGLYPSVIKYWDYLRQLNSDFMTSARTLDDIKSLFNDEQLKTAEIMQEYYFKSALNALVKKLEDDIDTLYFFYM